MSKLMHAVSLDGVKKNTIFWADNKYTDLAKNGIIFTEDGYIIGRGHEYYVGTHAKGTLTPGMTITDGKVTINDNNGVNIAKDVLLPVWKLSNGDVISVSANTGDWTINHNLRVKVGTETEVAEGNVTLNGFNAGTEDGTEYVITPTSFSFDKFGHISGIGTGTAISVDKVTDVVLNGSEDTKTIYLLGSTSATAAAYLNPAKFAGLKAEIDAEGKVTLTADTIIGTVATSQLSGQVAVANGGTGLAEVVAGGILYGNGTATMGVLAPSAESGDHVLLSGTTPSWRAIATSINLNATSANIGLTTEYAVAEAIKAGFNANDAMLFKGVVTVPAEGGSVAVGTLATDSAGYTWRVDGAGYFYSDGVVYAGIQEGKTLVGVVESGDLIICISNGTAETPATYAVVQANIDGAVTTANTADKFITDQLIVGAGDNKTIKALAAGAENQVLRMVKVGEGDNARLVPTWSADAPGRAIAVNGTQILDELSKTTLNFVEAADNCLTITGNADGSVTFAHKSNYTTAESGLYKITVDKFGHVSGTAAWDPKTLVFESVQTAYNATEGATDTTFDVDSTSGVSFGAARGLVLYKNGDVVTVGHTNQIEAVTEDAIMKFSYDVHGHVTSSTAWVPDVLTFTGVNGGTDPVIFNVDGTALTVGATAGIQLTQGEDGIINIGHSHSITSATVNVGKITFDAHGHITATEAAKTFTIAGVSYDGSVAKEIKLGTNLAIDGDTINATNTWRDVQVHKISGTEIAAASSIGTTTLVFSDTFSQNADGEIDMVWAEIDENGNVTYAI